MAGVLAEQSRIFRAFSDDRRLRILHLLRSGEACAGVIGETLNLAQSTLSYHLKILCDSGVVENRQEGKWIYYRVSPSGFLEAERVLKEFCPLALQEE